MRQAVFLAAQSDDYVSEFANADRFPASFSGSASAPHSFRRRVQINDDRFRRMFRQYRVHAAWSLTSSIVSGKSSTTPSLCGTPSASRKSFKQGGVFLQQPAAQQGRRLPVPSKGVPAPRGKSSCAVRRAVVVRERRPHLARLGDGREGGLVKFFIR